MNKLLLFIGENIKFDKNEVIDAITSFKGVKNAREGTFIGSIFECEVGELNTIIRLSEDLETITFDDLNDEILNFVLKVKSLLVQPISITDMDYNFHIELSEINTLFELKKKINE